MGSCDVPFIVLEIYRGECRRGHLISFLPSPTFFFVDLRNAVRDKTPSHQIAFFLNAIFSAKVIDVVYEQA